MTRAEFRARLAALLAELAATDAGEVIDAVAVWAGRATGSRARGRR